jgi:L-amino acid N-acyltransferase YncA
VVAEQRGKVIGFAYAGHWRTRPAYRHTAEDTVYVAPEQTGKGVGRLLLDAVLEDCRKAGVEQVIAVIADTGEPAAEALHRSVGFTEVGRLVKVGYKHGQWIDTVLMQLSLESSDESSDE